MEAVGSKIRNINNHVQTKISANISANTLKKTAIITAGATIGTGVVVFGAPLAVAAVGFGSSGITAGSTAAWLMSLSGGVTQAGGFVATCQSVGAVGAVASSTGALGTVVGGVAGYLASGNNDGSNREQHQGSCQEQREEKPNEKN